MSRVPTLAVGIFDVSGVFRGEISTVGTATPTLQLPTLKKQFAVLRRRDMIVILAETSSYSCQMQSETDWNPSISFGFVRTAFESAKNKLSGVLPPDGF